MLLHRKVGVPVKMHLLQFGNHVFNMGKSSEYLNIKKWPDVLTN